MGVRRRDAGQALVLAATVLLAACQSSVQTTTGEADASAGTAAPAGGTATASTVAGGATATTADTTADTYGRASAGGEGTVTTVIEARTLSDLPVAAEATPTSVDEATAVFDQPNDGDIESELGADHWSFTAEAGQLLALEIIEIGADCNQDLTLVIRDPEGTRSQAGWIGNGGCAVHGAFLLEQSGDYQFEFLGGDGSVITDNTGTYRFVPYWLTDIDESPISAGTPVEGAIDQPLGADRWSFSAEAGALLTVEVESIGANCSQDLIMNLVNPFGERQALNWVGNGGCSTQGPYELERAGDYVLEFRGGDGAIIEDNLGSYVFSIALS